MVSNPSNLLNRGLLENLAGGAVVALSRYDVAGDIPTVEKLRTVSWSKSFLWAFKFEAREGNEYAVPNIFADWFPAVDFEDTLASVENYTVQGPLSSYKIPQRTREKGFRLTFTDDETGTLLRWFEEWMELSMFNKGSAEDIEDGIATLDEVARKITYRSYKTTTETSIRRNYLIIPEGDLVEIGNSESDRKTYSLQFAIVGKFSEQVTDSSGKQSAIGSAITKLKRSASSFGFNPFG